MGLALGVINLGYEPELDELTMYRCCASLPFAGRYRLIDFALSNMVNSGIQNVGIFVRKKYRSLIDHLGSGKEWDLDRKQGGLYVLPPMFDEKEQTYPGDVYHFYNHMDYFYRAPESYVVITNGHTIYNVDYRKGIKSHIESGADITLLYLDEDEFSNMSMEPTYLNVDDKGRVQGINKGFPLGLKDRLFLETYIMKKRLFLEIIDNCMIEGGTNWVKDGLMQHSDKYTVNGHPCKGYGAIVDSVPSYFYHSMELLHPEVCSSLFFRKEPIYTRVKDEPPSLYKEGSKITNSLIGNGCKIEGKVENSILFRGVHVGKGAVVRNSIVMQRSYIGETSVVDGVIIDKGTFITEGKMIYRKKVDPLIIPKRSII